MSLSGDAPKGSLTQGGMVLGGTANAMLFVYGLRAVAKTQHTLDHPESLQ